MKKIIPNNHENDKTECASIKGNSYENKLTSCILEMFEYSKLYIFRVNIITVYKSPHANKIFICQVTN